MLAHRAAGLSHARGTRMPFFSRPNRDQIAEAARQEQSRQALEAGGLPTRARERLAEMVTSAGLTTSDLSPSEAALVKDAGYEPLGLVVGSCFYHVGMLYAQYQDGELQGLSRAYVDAQDLAVNRLEQETRSLDAHGVIGVRFEMVRREWAEHMIEVTAIGTAVRARTAGPERPFLSDLSGQEFWALREAGYQPRGLVYGNCIWVVYTTAMDDWRNGSWFNQEMSHMTQSVYRCRQLAMQRLAAMAKRESAEGVVGVRFDRRVGPLQISGSDRVHHAIYLTVIGTAIAERPAAPSHMTAALSIIDLRDRSAAVAQPTDVTLA